MNEPLAERIRPKTLEEFVSQQHLVGKDGVLPKHLDQGVLPSMIFWGPPGTGKTTLSADPDRFLSFEVAATSNRMSWTTHSSHMVILA